MASAGIFDEDERVELLEGVIVAMTPQSAPHARRIQWLTRFLVRTLGDEYAVRPQLPLTLGERNEPEPDLAVVRTDATSEDRHPQTAVLVIEVAGDSLRRDRRVKAAVYARAGIPEYWVVNLEARAVRPSRTRKPRPERTEGRAPAPRQTPSPRRRCPGSRSGWPSSSADRLQAASGPPGATQNE